MPKRAFFIKGDSREYFLYDALGSARQLTDDEANPLLTQTYDPYGTVYASVGVGASSFGYTGELVDANGLVYLRARYYQPGMGRFLNTDPSRQEMNPYQYTGSNPVNYVDPSGLICINGVDKWPYAVLPCSSGIDLGCAFQSMSEFYNFMTEEETLIYAHYLAAEGLLGEKAETYREYIPLMTRIMNPSQYYDAGEEHLFIWDVHEAGPSTFEIYIDVVSLGLLTVPTSLADDFIVSSDDAAAAIVREAQLLEALDDEIVDMYQPMAQLDFCPTCQYDVPDIRMEYSASQNARILRSNLQQSGIEIPQGYAAHHIVPSTHQYASASEAREILRGFNIDINDAVNGVPLSPGQHNPLHTYAYMDAVLRDLQRADTQGEAIEILETIAERLANNSYP